MNVPLGWFLAFRFLRDGRAQAALIILGVAVGVAVQVFVTLLINGLQADLIDRTLGIQPHITLTAAETHAWPLMQAREIAGVHVVSRVERGEQRARSIEGWEEIEGIVTGQPGVRVVSAKTSGPAVASRGAATYGVLLMGVDPSRFDGVVPITRNLVSGDLRLQSGDVAIGYVLAEDLGVAVGDSLRLGVDGETQRFVVRGIFDLGGQVANSQWAIVSRRAAQSMLGLSGRVTELDIKVEDVFEAEALAEFLAERTGLEQANWMGTNAQLLAALRSQSMSSLLIQFFVMCAVAMGIASVLVVSVVQKSGQIGILRAIGARRGTVMRIFLLEGVIMGAVGAVLGSLAGSGLVYVFHTLMRDDRGGPLFRLDYEPSLFAITFAVALGTGVAASALPARRASMLDPVVAIRHE